MYNKSRQRRSQTLLLPGQETTSLQQTPGLLLQPRSSGLTVPLSPEHARLDAVGLFGRLEEEAVTLLLAEPLGKPGKARLSMQKSQSGQPLAPSSPLAHHERQFRERNVPRGAWRRRRRPCRRGSCWRTCTCGKEGRGAGQRQAAGLQRGRPPGRLAAAYRSAPKSSSISLTSAGTTLPSLSQSGSV